MTFGGQFYFTRTLPDGTREVGWRLWLLVWILPVLLLAASVLMLGYEGYRHVASVPTTGEVVKVYAWDGETMFDRGKTNYGPVFRYQWTDGSMTEASAGMSHPDWNFEIGSVHAIRYMPGVKTNIVLVSRYNWFAPLIILGLGIVTAIPAALITRALLRWKARGTTA